MRALKNHMFGFDPRTEKGHQQKTGEIWTKPILLLIAWHCIGCLLLHHKLLQNNTLFKNFKAQIYYLRVSVGQKSRRSVAGSHKAEIKVSVVFLWRLGSFKLNVGRTHFVAAIWLRSLFSCWLLVSGSRGHPQVLATWSPPQAVPKRAVGFLLGQ